jgi:hypothetical protein
LVEVLLFLWVSEALHSEAVVPRGVVLGLICSALDDVRAQGSEVLL